MKHKYYDVIVAWASGKVIQCREVSMSGTSIWRDFATDVTPNFNADIRGVELEWRIKPDEPVARWLWAVEVTSSSWFLGGYFYTEEEAKAAYKSNHKKLEWTRTEFPQEGESRF